MGERPTKFSSGNLKRSELERPGLGSEDKLKWLLKKKNVYELHVASFERQ
jgi:hypothetical protein